MALRARAQSARAWLPTATASAWRVSKPHGPGELQVACIVEVEDHAPAQNLLVKKQEGDEILPVDGAYEVDHVSRAHGGEGPADLRELAQPIRKGPSPAGPRHHVDRRRHPAAGHFLGHQKASVARGGLPRRSLGEEVDGQGAAARPLPPNRGCAHGQDPSCPFCVSEGGPPPALPASRRSRSGSVSARSRAAARSDGRRRGGSSSRSPWAGSPAGPGCRAAPPPGRWRGTRKASGAKRSRRSRCRGWRARRRPAGSAGHRAWGLGPTKTTAAPRPRRAASSRTDDDLRRPTAHQNELQGRDAVPSRPGHRLNQQLQPAVSKREPA